MICYANDLSPDQRATLETLLGRRVQDGEAISLRTFAPATISPQRKQEIASELRKYFSEVDAARKPATEIDREDITTEAMRSVRPAEPFLHKAGIEVLDDIALMQRLRS